MKKGFIFALCISFIVTMTSCSVPQISDSPNSTPSKIIPANSSVNIAWGGGMCEANGNVYCVFSKNSNGCIVRMEPDGNAVPVTSEYYSISELTSDNKNIYFIVTDENNETQSLYSVPVNGGKEHKILDGHFSYLQCVNKRLFWEDYFVSDDISSNQTADVKINSINIDGSDPKTLLTQTVDASIFEAFDFVVTNNALYYVQTTYNINDDKSEIYKISLSGKNKSKLNHSPLDTVDYLFYDQGNLYFLLEHFFDGAVWDSLEKIDKSGKVKTVVKIVGYYPQDVSTIEYCGISNNIVYYFDTTPSNGSHLYMALHQYDISHKKDTVILRNVDMGDNYVTSLRSVRGKNIKNSAIDGMYILGNDVYFEPYSLP